MRKYVCFYIAVLLVAALTVSAQDKYSENARNYIQQYYPLALLEQKTNGIPAAVTLGQGILETEAGTSELMTNANNHFGIKCKNGWTGETYTHTDDAPDECFKKYRCAADSYRDHSEHLKKNPRYAPLFGLKKTDYKSWAIWLKKCGYATNPQYAQRLIQIIEDFDLERYTLTDFDSSMLKDSDVGYKVYAASYATPVKDSAVKQVPKDTGKRVTAAPVKAPPRIVITHDRHTVKEGETLAMIAKSEDVDIKQIMQFNFLYPNEEPVPGSVLELQKQAGRKPEVIIGATTAHKTNAIMEVGEKPAAQGDDYVAIDRTKHSPAPDPVYKPAAAPAATAVAAPSKPAQPVAAAVPARQRFLKQPVNKPADEDNVERDRELTSLKAELDKVVYADDSKLIAENQQPAPVTASQARPEPVKPAAAAKGTKFYTVKRGDTAFSIAKRNNITVDQLMKWNDMETGGVKVGQNLRVKE